MNSIFNINDNKLYRTKLVSIKPHVEYVQK